MQSLSGKRGIAVLVVVAAAALGFVFLLQPRRQPAAQAQTNPIPYQTARVQKGDLSEQVEVTGAVRSNQSTLLAWQTSGTVVAVHAVEGQVVPAGTLLAELDRLSVPQTVILAQASLVAAQKNLDNLLNTNQDRAAAQLALVKAEKALEDAQKARRNKLYQVASPETIDIARANLILAKDALDNATTIYDRNKNRSDDDVIFAAALSQLAAAQQRYDQAKYNFDYVSGLPDPLDIEMADANLAMAQANLLAAKQQWERVKDGPNDQDVAAIQAQIDAAQATLNLTRITAPFGGTVTLTKQKSGDQVAAGTPAFQVDDLSRLLMDVEVSQADIARVQVGQPVVLAWDALTGREYTGTVSQIDRVGKSIAGAVNFTVTVEITQPGEEIRPGMTGTAKIAVRQARGALLVPNRAIRTRDGKSVVYRLQDGTPSAVEVTLGAASGDETAVASGVLQEGDLVIINPAVVQ